MGEQGDFLPQESLGGLPEGLKQLLQVQALKVDTDTWGVDLTSHGLCGQRRATALSRQTL